MASPCVAHGMMHIAVCLLIHSKFDNGEKRDQFRVYALKFLTYKVDTYQARTRGFYFQIPFRTSSSYGKNSQIHLAVFGRPLH